MMLLNQPAAETCKYMLQNADRLRISAQTTGGVTVIDCGAKVRGGLEAGRLMAEVCLGGLGNVSVQAGRQPGSAPRVCVQTDHPVAACMGAQYAGWQISSGKYFAMGSGPFRAAGSKEKLIDEINCRETTTVAAGVLETRKAPPEDVCLQLASDCGVQPENLYLLMAPTASIAGTLQVVARTVETALHKIHELKFDIAQIVSGYGSAPLPPIAGDDMAAIGRTNDAVLYGGEVTLWVESDDAVLQQLAPQIPSNASHDHGQPFAEIFKRYDHDFYKIDPLLFSPAIVTLVNLTTGNSFTAGQLTPENL